MNIITLLLLCAALGLSGCASSSKTAKANKTDVNWIERVGTYTYAEALAELGRPMVITESADGTTAEWVVRRSPRVSFGFGVGGGSYGSRSGVGVGVGSSVSPPPHGESIRLSFDNNGKLKEWSRVKY